MGERSAETGGRRLSLRRIEEASRCIDPVFLDSPQYEAEVLGDTLGASRPGRRGGGPDPARPPWASRPARPRRPPRSVG